MLFYILLLFHILFVALWFGGGVFLMVLAHMGYQKGRNELAVIAKLGASSAMFFGAVSGLTLLTGISMMFLPQITYSWGANFITVGFTVFFLSSFLEARFLRPAFATLGQAAIDDNAKLLQQSRLKVLLFGASNIALIFVAIVFMVFKF